MAKKVKDITKTGALSYRDLQEQNALNPATNVTAADLARFMQDNKILGSQAMTNMVYDQNARVDDYLESSSLAGQNTRLGNPDYWGNSIFDPDIVVGEQDWNNLSDVRAENQPWYSKLTNGVGKAGVLAVTTALETAGLLYGAGHSLLESVGAIEDNKKSWLQDLWDNPITNALQKVTEVSEEYMPNYYTRDEQENPFGNIFTANFLGDKLLKNLGFMVGAFYGGIPLSYGIGKIGTSAVKSARAASLAERAGMARATRDIYREANLISDAVERQTFIDGRLAAMGLTEAERGKKIADGLDKINRIAQTTRATTQTIGSLGSAINEGAIEALNNSKDWARMATQQENERYQAELEEELGKIDTALGGTEVAESAMLQKRMELAAKHEEQLAEIEKGRASMGNADLLLNIPILMASNMYQLGKLYTRGFDSTRRQMGSLWNGHKLSGDLAKGTLKSDKTWKGALGTALLKSNTEGLEEYLQRAASDGAGNAVNESLKRFFDAGQNEEAKTNVDDYIAGFGKAIADNLGDPNAWEEYMIGALSSMIGMPVFGSQTKNAYMKAGPVGLAEGLYGNYKEYMDARDHENKVAEYLNNRVKDPKFKALYDNLKKQDDYDRWLQEELEKGNKSKYKDLELEKFYSDLNAAASSGHLEEFKQLVGYNIEYSDEELEDIVKQTTREITPEQQRKADEDRKNYLESQIAEYNKLGRAITPEEAKVYDELDEVNKRLQEDNYQKKLDGPFIDRNGQMNVTNPDKMREILEKNRQNLLQGIDDYLKIRNDIDIETDGRLDDDQIELLTQMKGKILDYEKRSAEMADDLIGNLGDVQAKQEKWQEGIKRDLEVAQKEYNDAKAHLEAVKKGKHSEEHKNKIEKEVLAAEKKLNKAKAADRSVGNGIRLLQMLLEEKSTTAEERAAEAEGYGDGLFGRINARFAIGTQRKINSDEAQAILANPLNALTLIKLINSKTSGLDSQMQQRLTQEVVDLSSLANQKMSYNKKIREFMGDPQKINEAYQQAQDQISQKEKDNKSEELSLNIKNANSMVELDRVMRDAYNVNPEIAKSALDKAKQTADENTKKFIVDYEKAVNFYGDVARQSQKLPQEIASGIIGTAESEWENALQEGVDVYDKFVDGMNEAAEELDKAGTPEAKETAAGIRQVLSDLNAAKKSVATNKNVKKSASKKNPDVEEGTSSDEEKKGFAALNARLAAKRAGKPGEETPSTDTKESLQDAVEQEVRSSKQKKGTYKIDDLSKLSKELKDRIQKYNEENPGSEFMIDFEQLLQRLVDEDIADDGTNLGNSDLKNDGSDLGDDSSSEKAEAMHNNLRVTFRSDYPTEFRIYDGNNLLDYRVPYNPDTEQLQAVQKLLQNLKAYHFIDKNYLGYVAKALEAKGKNVTVHLLRSTDDTVNSDKTNPITFLAIKFDDEAENAIRKYGYGNSRSVNLADEISPVHINGERYHIIGVMTLNSDVASEVSKAFASLQGELNKELNPQIEEARDNGQPFVVSKLTTVVDTINTGRLEKRDNEDDKEGKVSLYDFVATQQGDSSRSTSSEWSNGMDFYFGTVVNGFLNSIEDDEIRSQWEEPNSTWMGNNNGAVVMFVPKADGNFYPVRVTRRTVGDWLKSTVDGTNTGEQLLSSLLDGSVTNEYLGNIINYLKDIYNEDSTISAKMNAKMMLQKYFIFGKESPIHFNNGEVALQFENREYELPVGSFEEYATAFFNTLAQEKIKFSLPAESIESVKGREVIKSGVFEIGLRGFYNFNANFTIRAIDATGTDITSQVETSNDEHFTGGNNIRGGVREYDFGDGLKTYYVTPDATGRFIKVVDSEGNPVSNDILNLINIIEDAQHGRLQTWKESLINTSYSKSPQVREFVLSGVKGFDNLFLINGEETWIYKSGDSKPYKLTSEKGKELERKLKKAISDFVQENVAKIKELKKAEPAGSTSTLSESVVIQDNKKGLFGLKNLPQAYIKNSNGLWVPLQIGLHEAYKLPDGTITHGGSLTGYAGLLERNRVQIPDGTGEYLEVSPDMIVGVGYLKGAKFIDKTNEAQKEAEAAQKSSSLSKEDAEDALRNVGKQMKDAMNTSGNIEEMEALLELGQVAIEQARTAGVGEGIIKNIEGIRKGLQVKYNNHKKAKNSSASVGNNSPKQGTLFVGKTLDDMNAKNGGLEEILAAHKKSPIIKGTPEKNGKPARMGVFEALQIAEEAGKPIDQEEVTRSIQAILAADSKDRASMLSDLVHRITCG